jgi:hypothetical protein
MAFAGARRAEKERIFPLRDEARGRELADERAVHLLVEIEIKVVERAAGITKAGQFVPALEQAILSPVEFVCHERGHKVDGRHFLGLGLAQSGFEDRSHARQPQFAGAPDRVRRDSFRVSSSAINEVAIERELPNQGIDLAQGERHGPTALEIVADET